MKEQEKKQTTTEELRTMWDLGSTMYRRDFKRLRLLDATDRGDLWKAIGATFPPYQILPDTNFVSYVKSNLLASIYSVAKSAELIPTREEDKDLCVNLNVTLDWFWDTQNVALYQFQAGERAALCNVGYTRVGWDESVSLGSGDNIVKGNVRLQNVDPLKFMRDPYAVDLDAAKWCCTYEDFHKSMFIANKDYKEGFEEYMRKGNDGASTDTPASISPDNISKTGVKDYYTLVIWWIRNDDGSIDEIHTINNQQVLQYKANIKPSVFPFAPLYCNLPAGALIGTSEPAKIFANNIAYNLMDSLALTAEYKNQSPPRFISDQSKLNVQAFAKHGSEADKTFVVAGDATKAVHYHQFPQVSNTLPQMKMSLEYGIQNVTGIDGRYTGRDTGSIITTGGTQEMLARVTIIDTPKITMYENYCKRLTMLILKNMLEHCPKRKFFVKRPNSTKYKSVEVDFPQIDSDTLFNYRMAISSELPKNKQRIASMATELLKEQSQYNQNGGTNTVSWITEEEWLMFQDLPMKEYMLERMGVERMENALEEVSQVLYQYADMLQNGADNDQAMQATAQTLMNTRKGMSPDVAMEGNPELEAMALQAGT